MTGRERAIGAALAVVVLIGVIDAAAGHNGTSKSAPVTTTGEGPQTTVPTSTVPTPTVTPASTPAPTGHRRHTGVRSTQAASTAPMASAEPTSGGAGVAPGSTTASSPSQWGQGVLGTFSYATTGYEETNYPGTHRTFPKTTTITNKREGCGVSSTWAPNPDHTQKQVLCPAGNAIKVASYQTTITFYGVSSGENFTCSGASYVYKPGVAAGDTWKYQCKSPDSVASQTARVIGYETVNVGGTAVRTLHIHLATTLSGQASGTSTQDYWIATSKPVLVKEQGTVKASQQNAHYDEVYSLALKSLSPKT